MLNQIYRLKTGLPGFALVSEGRTTEFTIPAGAVVRVVRLPSDNRDLAMVLWDESTCEVPVRELQKCGTRIQSIFRSE